MAFAEERDQKRKVEPKPEHFPLSEHPTIDHALNIYVIFKNLMSMLPLKDALNCGMLNRNWNWKSREYIRDCRVCYVQIGNRIPCETLEAFCGFLRTCSHVPFNGISISPKCSNGTCPLFKTHIKHNLMENRNQISLHKVFSSFTIKHLQVLPLISDSSSVQLLGPPWMEGPITFCYTKQFLLHLLQKEASNLVSIVVSCPLLNEAPLNSLTKLFLSNSNKPWLSNLRAIEIRQKPKNTDAVVIDSLIKASPNLQSFIGFLRSSQIQLLISQGKSHIIRELVLTGDRNLDTLFATFAQTKPRLWILTIPEQWDWTCFNVFKRITILQEILQSSCRSLTEINVDFSLLRIFMKHFDGPFENVDLLRVKYSQCLDKNLGSRLLKSIDFSRLFPNLSIIELYLDDSLGVANEFLLYEFEGFVKEHICGSVTKLRLRSSWDYSWNTEILHVLKELFPNVRHFQVQHVRNLRTFLRRLWTAWMEIESIDLYLTDESVRQNLDGIFCGISEDDVEELLVRGSRVLEEGAWIEPEQCCIKDLTNLKLLRVQIHHAFDCIRREACRNTFITRVTGRLAFSQMPSLQVEVIRNECEWTIWEGFQSLGCYFNFRQLEPFAKIISIDPEDSWEQKFDFKYYEEPHMLF